MKNIRESNFELLRIICIFGIIYMHLTGPLRNIVTIQNEMGVGNCIGLKIFLLLENSIFNIGVSLFVLISGYFGITYRREKGINLWTNTLFYSLISIFLFFIYSTFIAPKLGLKIIDVSYKDLIKSFFPICTNRYWFITSYLLLFVLSPYINEIAKKLSKIQFSNLILFLLIVFSILPTIFMYNLFNDSGKGPLNVFLVYLLGNYLSLYVPSGKHHFLYYFLSGLGIILLGFLGNVLMSILLKRYFIYYCVDYSIFTVMGAVFIFLAFRELKLKNRLINFIAKYVLVIYLFEGAVRKVISMFINLNDFAFSWKLPFIIICIDLLIIVLCILFDIIFSSFKKIIFCILEKLVDKALSIRDRILLRLNN